MLPSMLFTRWPSLLLLDCDGVLIRSEKANLAFYNHLFASLGLPPVAEDDRGALGLLHTLSTPQVVERFVPAPLREAAAELVPRLSFAPFVPLLEGEPGWPGVLARLAPYMRRAVATNRGASAREVLRTVGVLDELDLVVTIRDVPRPKPHPDLLLAALRHFGMHASDALYVGDSELDRTAAAAAGVPFVGFRLRGEPSVDTPEELEALLLDAAPARAGTVAPSTRRTSEEDMP